MSVFPIPTNFSGLIRPRSSKTQLFSGTGTTMSSTTALALQGYIGAGSVIVGAYVQGAQASTDYKISISGAYAAYTGDVAKFTGVVPVPSSLNGAFGVPLTQDSYVIVSTSGSSVTIPKAIITYIE